MAVTDLNFTLVDHSDETSNVTFHAAAIAADGANWDDVVTGVAGNRALLGAALNTLSNCNEILSSVNVRYAVTTKVLPDEPADRELAVRFTYQDTTTGKYYRFDVPGPIEGIYKTNSDEVDMANVTVAAFKVVFDANAVSEVGNAVSLLSGRKVGRKK